MQEADTRGVLLNYDSNAIKYETTGVFQEMIGNRLHGKPSPDGTTTFLIATFIENGARYLVLASSQMRTKENINQELTPWRANLTADEEDAKLNQKGSGAKMFPFNVRGTYVILYQTVDQPLFSSKDEDWMGTRETDVGDLSTALHNLNEEFDIGPYKPLHINAKRLNPFWNLPGVASSPLMNWIRQSGLRSFYVYRDYREMPDLDNHVERLALIYEDTDVRIMRSKNLETPSLVTPKPFVSLGLVPKYWKDSVTMYCKLGTSANRFFDSQFKIVFPYGGQMYLKIVPNGKKENPSPNLTEDKEANWDTEEADCSVTGAILSEEYIQKEADRVAAPYLGQSDPTLARVAYMRIEGDLISDNPVLDSEVGQSIRTALLDLNGSFRIIVNLLNAKIMKNVNAGIVIEGLKRDTKIQAKKGVHECIKRMCTILKRCKATSFEETAVRRAADSVALHRNSSKQRSTEGKKYEQVVSDQLAMQFEMISWTMGDVLIQQRHGLTGQGIDCMGTWGSGDTPEYCIAIQIKDVKTLSLAQVQKFTSTVKEFQSKNPTMLVFAFLVWKNPKDSIPRKIYEELDEIDARLLFDSNIFTRIQREVGGHYDY